MKHRNGTSRPRRLARALVIGPSLAAAVLLTAGPALALSAFATNATACGAFIPGAKLAVYTPLYNDDKGTADEILTGSYAKVKAYRCSDGREIPFTGRLTWAVTASGWGIDSCAGGLPPGFTCSGGTTSRTMTDVWDFTNSYGFTRTKTSYESFYFTDGSVGDTTKVCSKVTGTAVVNSTAHSISASACVSA